MQHKPGDFIAGEYRVLKVFGGEGKSGMGVVYLVENRSFYEPFVLKTYQASELGDRKERFLKEAETWVQLGRHPNIVRCLWVNDISGDVYVAAEYIAFDEDGFSTLEDRIRAGLIPLDKQLAWSAHFLFRDATRAEQKFGRTSRSQTCKPDARSRNSQGNGFRPIEERRKYW